MSNKQLDELFNSGSNPSFSAEPTMSTEPSISAEPTTLQHGEVDREGAMAKADLYKLAKYASKLYKKLEDEDQLESWVQAKITKAADYIASVYHYLEYEMDFSKYGHKLENADMMNEDQKAALLNKLVEARTKIAELKKLQAEKLEEGKKAKPDFLDLDNDNNTKEPMKKASKEQKCDEMFFYGKEKNRGSQLPFKKDSESGIKPPGEIHRANKKAGKPQDVLGRRPEGGVAKYGDEYKSMVKGTGLSGKYAKQVYPLGGPKGTLPEEMNETSEEKKKAYRDAAGKDMQKAAKEGDKARVSKRLKGVSASLKNESAKPDFLDLDDDDNTKEPMKKAAKEKKCDEAAPSAGLSAEKKSATVKKAKAGGDIGKKGKGFEKIASKAAKKYGSKEKGEKVAAAAMWKNIKREDIDIVKEAVKKAKESDKDYDGDGKVESGKDEYLGSKDKAIKKAMGKKCVKESIEHEGLIQQLARILADAGYNSTDITAPEDVAYGLENNHKSMQMWNAIDEDEQWNLVDEIANAVYDLVGSGDEESNPDYGSTRLHESSEFNRMKALTKRLLG